VGNPDLEPEQSTVWEVGVEQVVGVRGGQVSLSWFDQKLEDLIQHTFASPRPGDPNYFNVAEARSRGLEVAARLPLGAAVLTAGYTYLHTEVLDAGFDEGPGATFVEGEPLIRRPKHQGGLGGTYRFERGSLSAQLRWVGSRSDRDFGAWPVAPVEMHSFTLVGVGGEVVLRQASSGAPGFTLSGRVENLLDEAYQETFGFRAPGRAYVVGGRVSFGG
jgi:vitamin B12 transporter